MDTDSDKPLTSTEKSADMRERRKKAGVVQVGFFVRQDDKAEVIKAMRDYTDAAWLALYDAGAVLHGANEARADDIRQRLGLTSKARDDRSESLKGS